MTTHRPVLLKEVLELLKLEPNDNFVDATVGGGGHAEAVLQKTGLYGKVLGIDWDKEAVNRTGERLKSYGNRLVLVNDSYTNIKKIVADLKFTYIRGVLIDLGLSSDQLQASGRGFSFQTNEPLDMRFSPDTNDLTAAEILNKWPEERIKEILSKNAEEQFSGRIAAAIVAARQERPIEKTLQLVEIIMKAVPKRLSRIHPATKTFQALRIEVNDEFGNIKKFLNDVADILEPGARLAVITFHSLEDRIVKQFFKKESTDCLCPPEVPVCVCGHKAKFKLITPKAVKPSEEEVNENFRARSAKLRVVEKK